MGRQRIEPGPGQESVWDYPRPPRLEDSEKRVKVVFGGITLADTTRAKRVLETSHPPVYYVPPEDVRMEYLALAEGTSFCEWKGAARYYDVETDERRDPRAAWFYPNPVPAYASLKDYVAFYPSLMDGCWVDGEKVEAQEGDFYGGWITSDIVGPFKGGPGTWGWQRVNSYVADLRKEYTHAGLREANADRDPIEQFRKWFDEALAADLHEPNAMTLATATPDGRPSARVVLLKGFDERGFVFYTNYEGRKARELEENQYCALVFYWGELERQVRIEGRASRVSAEECDAYYRSRPRGSKLGAWVSEQSRPVEDRGTLEKRLRELETQYEGREVPRPSFWGGYRVEPEEIEFWQGRENRLHDRLLYRRSDSGWDMVRLQP